MLTLAMLREGRVIASGRTIFASFCPFARYTMAGGGDDARERLLSPQDRRVSREHEEQEEGDDGFTHEELLHSIGSFSAVVPPVAATMLLARCVDD